MNGCPSNVIVTAPIDAGSARRGYTPSIRNSSVVIPSVLQIVTFVAGLVLLVVFGRLN